MFCILLFLCFCPFILQCLVTSAIFLLVPSIYDNLAICMFWINSQATPCTKAIAFSISSDGKYIYIYVSYSFLCNPQPSILARALWWILRFFIYLFIYMQEISNSFKFSHYENANCTLQGFAYDLDELNHCKNMKISYSQMN